MLQKRPSSGLLVPSRRMAGGLLDFGGRRKPGQKNRMLDFSSINGRSNDMMGSMLGFGPRVDEEESHIVSEYDLSPSRRFESTVTCMIGRRGRGKTQMMTILGLMQHDWYRAQEAAWKIMTNYYTEMHFYDDSDECSVETLAHPKLVDRIIQFADDIRDVTVCLDEIQTAIPNRRSSSSANVSFAGQFLTQIRKRNMELVTTTQFPQILDYLFLIQTDLFVRCEGSDDGRAIRLEKYDFWGQYTGLDYRKPWPPRPGTEDEVQVIGNTDQAYKVYKSGQIVAPIKSDHRGSIEAAEWGDMQDNDRPPELVLEETEAPDARIMARAPNAIVGMMMGEMDPFPATKYFGQAKSAGFVKTLPQYLEFAREAGFEIYKDGKRSMMKPSEEMADEIEEGP